MMNAKVSYPHLNSLGSLKLIMLVLIFIWHTDKLVAYPDLGAMGVMFFFTVSGFLTSYNHAGRMSYTCQTAMDILRRKLRGFYPLHVFTFLLAAMLNARELIAYLGWKVYLSSALLNLALLQSWFPDIKFLFNGVSWFLSSLLVCYFCSPFIMYFIDGAMKSGRRLAALWLAVLALRAAADGLIWTGSSMLFLDVYANPLVRMLEFFSGACAGAFFLLRRDRLKGWLQAGKARILAASFLEAVMLIAGCILVYCLDRYGLRPVFLPVFTAACLLFAMEGGWISRLLNNSFLRSAGKIELEFFMLHQIVIKYMDRLCPGESYFYYAAVFVLVIFLSYICYFCRKRIHF